MDAPPRAQFGVASWYGEWHHGRETAMGELFDQWALTAAHPTLPLGSVIEVTNVANGRRVRVRVNDRGPVVNGRILDLSRAAAQRIGPLGAGVYHVRIRVVDNDAVAVASDAQPAEHVRRAAAHDPQPSAVRRASLRGR